MESVVGEEEKNPKRNKGDRVKKNTFDATYEPCLPAGRDGP